MGSASTRSKILIVDDSAAVRDAARFVLEQAGYSVVVLETPFMFSQVLNAEKPDLVLMDVAMPGLNGDKLVLIAQRSGVHTCPVVFFSAQPASELEHLVRFLGVAGYIEKSMASLVRDVARYLPKPSTLPTTDPTSSTS